MYEATLAILLIAIPIPSQIQFASRPSSAPIRVHQVSDVKAGAVGANPLQGVTTTASCFGYNQANDNSLVPGIVGKLRIAVLVPVLTSTPYSQYKYGSFYAFYSKYRNVSVGQNVTTDLGLLNTSISSGYDFQGGWGLSLGLYKFLTSPTAEACGLEVGANVRLLDDINVSEGALFAADGSPGFDVVVAPFSEYTIESEYRALETFVSGGGVLVLLDAHSLDWRVSYNTTTRSETLVQGHGWAFDGVSARKIPCAAGDYAACPWESESTKWIASSPCCTHAYRYHGAIVNAGNPMGGALAREFGATVFNSYSAHEENAVTNMTGTTIVATFVNQSGTLEASYVHAFRKGVLICMCVFGDDIIASDPSAQYFLILSVIFRYLSPGGICPRPVATGQTAACPGLTSGKVTTQGYAAGSNLPLIGGAIGGSLLVLCAVAVLRWRTRRSQTR